MSADLTGFSGCDVTFRDGRKDKDRNFCAQDSASDKS